MSRSVYILYCNGEVNIISRRERCCSKVFWFFRLKVSKINLYVLRISLIVHFV
jgi:hypothetical protein